MLVVLLGEVERMLVVPGGSTHLDSRLHVKIYLTILRLGMQQKIGITAVQSVVKFYDVNWAYKSAMSMLLIRQWFTL